MSKNPITTITIENGKSIKIELYPEIAPNTINNFISLIKKKFKEISVNCFGEDYPEPEIEMS